MESVHSILPLSDNLFSSTEMWAFRSAIENSWIAEAFALDTQILTKALHNSISNNIDSPNVSYSEPLNSEAPSSERQTHSFSSSTGATEPETVSKRDRNAPSANGKIKKRKSRASKRSPTTFINTDPENFRQMVQQVTGSGMVVGSVVKPEPCRPVGVVNRLQTGYVLPTLDTSAFLLDNHQKRAVGSGPVNVDIGPGSVVVEDDGSGFDFNGFTGFPALESWN
ncbi:calmodulin-binding protein 25-like [Amaranthus tricolor]|uniref:calmodulin-binding protein 25-like n=1 Tax=Amaranthus tricolor TaxID=29722 RepID=UPI00258F1528|nr:calmodulin-binding protein 25-like [Amaranthus tricolor]